MNYESENLDMHGEYQPDHLIVTMGIKKYKRCPNCGRKGMYEATKSTIIFLPNKTHKCKYCDMEFELKINKGEWVWDGEIPRFC